MEEDKRYKAVNGLFKPTYIRGATTMYGVCSDDYQIVKLNYFDYQYYLHEGEDEVIKSYKKEEDFCRQFLKEEIGFTELIVSIENFYTLQTILLNLECEYQRRFIYEK